jgi:hypothetical protein
LLHCADQQVDSRLEVFNWRPHHEINTGLSYLPALHHPIDGG